MAIYKAVMRPALKYVCYIWSPLASSTSINKMKLMQNTALRTTTGFTQDKNIQHLYGEILILSIHKHLQLHASQYKQKTQHPSHPLNKHTSTIQGSKHLLSLTTAATKQTFPEIEPKYYVDAEYAFAMRRDLSCEKEDLSKVSKTKKQNNSTSS